MEPGGMVEEVGDSDLGRDHLIIKSQIGEVGAYRGVQNQDAFIDQMPDNSAGVGLGERADLKERLRRHRAHGGETGQTERSVLFTIASEETDGGARDLV